MLVISFLIAGKPGVFRGKLRDSVKVKINFYGFGNIANKIMVVIVSINPFTMIKEKNGISHKY